MTRREKDEGRVRERRRALEELRAGREREGKIKGFVFGLRSRFLEIAIIIFVIPCK